MPFVYSTLACDNTYNFHQEQTANDLPQISRQILIKGGAKIANKLLQSPAGVMTEIKREEAELLAKHPVFMLHEKNGHVKIHDKKMDTEVAVSDMEARDKSSPLVPQDYEGKEGAKPSNKTANQLKAAS